MKPKSVFLTVFIIIQFGSVTFSTSKTPDCVIKDWEKNYKEQTQEVARHSLLSKKTVDESSVFDRQSLIWNSDQTPFDVKLRRTEALLAYLKTLPHTQDLSSIEQQLQVVKSKRNTGGLSKKSATMSSEKTDDKSLYLELSSLARKATFANSLINFTDILFVARQNANRGWHMCTPNNGHNQEYGGGLYVLKNAFTNPQLVDILANSTVQSGRLAGMKLGNGNGAFISPDLSYDGKTVVFAWAQKGDAVSWADVGTYNSSFTKERSFHIFKVNIDGTDLVQLTDGPCNC